MKRMQDDDTDNLEHRLTLTAKECERLTGIKATPFFIGRGATRTATTRSGRRAFSQVVAACGCATG